MANRPPPMRVTPQSYIAQMFEALARDPRAEQGGPDVGMVWRPNISVDTEAEMPPEGFGGVRQFEAEDVIDPSARADEIIRQMLSQGRY